MKRKLSGLASALFGKKERKESPPETGLRNEEEGRKTEPESGPAESDPPVRFWEEEDPPYQITLTDVQALNRCYRHIIGDALLIGFSAEMDICVNYDKSVSRRHCEILREGDCFFIVNHSQSNGTYLNRRAVTEKTPIFDGDVITMGRVEMRLEIDG